ncbi:hypothetical protein EDC96DRAFT_506904 [Choanephora cucurbitarum]|nr:hypothetical protein EDC96DRAFT_532417 [Choanephora cucurbitarum]KAI8330516.1 hypothetical protein EDC96DRAFT_528205 [Choanephora cucurbitarum]KAI8331119.1 hypothetical protein EDC96DRAFT_527345 [Choanephora cucurbitarum]KAI8331121.1 hypothetical protein EDC96DRAFT_527393 [Choanephora cucurbitarum]KAI8367125.1 hypothetical protein EDC96DRAFT_506904 [Choanephora cucurbitarum]
MLLYSSSCYFALLYNNSIIVALKNKRPWISMYWLHFFAWCLFLSFFVSSYISLFSFFLYIASCLYYSLHYRYH